MVRATSVALLVFVCARAEEPQVADSPARFLIQWQTNSPSGQSVSVRAAGGADAWMALEAGAAKLNAPTEKRLVVEVEQADVLSSIGWPALAGKYNLVKEGIDFRPQFPFQPGVKYRATFFPKSGRPVSSVLEIPLAKREPSTVVTEIYPTADVLPENLLKFYLYFSAPMSGGHIYEHIRLTEDGGKVVELPFLEIDEELWNPEMTRLTLFLDPGRIKRGVKPLEEIGAALQAGKRYTLGIDSSWIDATGTTLKRSFEKKFRVAEVDREAPDLAKWQIISPKVGTTDPLRVVFSDPMDHALALRMIFVDSVAGEKKLEEHERVWIFTPEKPWAAGSYRRRVQTTIEDLAGNNIGKPFEVDLFKDVQKRLTREVVERVFEVK
jgi:hypothetical protein